MDDKKPPMNSEDQSAPDQENTSLSLIQVIGSVLAAGLGVQSREDKVRDFTRGKPLQFLIAGILFTVLFVGGLITLVSMVTSQ